MYKTHTIIFATLWSKAITIACRNKDLDEATKLVATQTEKYNRSKFITAQNVNFIYNSYTKHFEQAITSFDLFHYTK